MSVVNHTNVDLLSNLTIINSDSNSSKIKYIESHQSANTLFHFMKRFEWLCDILKTGKINPRYCEERFDFLDNSLPSLAFPMKCFCDIYLEKLHYHTPTYGEYGLGFSKSWLISQNVQPVQYINPSSEIGEAIKKAFLEYIEEYGDTIPREKHYDILFRQLRYIKPILGKMTREGIEGEYNFHDEREWRFIPNIPLEDDSLELVWNGTYCTPNKIKIESEKLSKNNKYVIIFPPSELKYIIVPTEKDSENIRNFIFNELTFTEFDRLTLISKILVFDIAKGDW